MTLIKQEKATASQEHSSTMNLESGHYGPPPPYDDSTTASTPAMSCVPVALTPTTTENNETTSPNGGSFLSDMHQTVTNVLGMRPDPLVTALCAAASNGDLDRVEDLLKAGAPVEGTDEHGNTALFSAVAASRRHVAQYLVLHGASLAGTSMRQPLLYTAAATGNPEMVTLLLDLGADPNARDLTGLSIFSEAMRRPERLAVARVLLERGADPRTRDLHGETALTLAVRQDSDDLVAALLLRGADPNDRNMSGQPLLSWVVEKRNVAMAQRLLAYSGNPNTRDLTGQPVLAAAVQAGLPELVRCLVKQYAADLNLLDNATKEQAESMLD